MTPILREYLLKGVFLGLWAYLALILPPSQPDWPRFGVIVAFVAAGLLLGVVVGGIAQFRRGFRPTSNFSAFALVVLLESSFAIYAGLNVGLALGLSTQVAVNESAPITKWLLYFTLGGIILGYGFHQLRMINDWFWRFGLGAIIGAVLVYLSIHYLELSELLPDAMAKRQFSIVLLLGLPLFYLLTFCGAAEESEVEIAAICATLGIGLYLFGLESGLEATAGKLILLVPLLLYFIYVTRIMPGLKVFKYTLRGYSALHIHDQLYALQCFKRALRLDPRNELATSGMMSLHQQVDVANLPADSELLRHLDYNFCLDHASSHLIGERAPSVAEREKADRMLALVERQFPKLTARVDYLRCVSLVHAKQFDAAAELLSRLLNPETPYDDTIRRSVLLPAWDLALRLHPEIVKRVGDAELAKPGRRMQAIAAIERQLASDSNDAIANMLKERLYTSLLESEFVADSASGPPTEFNYDYVEQIGWALCDSTDAEKRNRGMGFLRIAARGLPARGPQIFRKLADVATANGQADETRGYLDQVKRCGVEIGVKNLSEEQRQIYFTTVRESAADAEARGDFDRAIGDYRLYLEGGRGELETYRKMADLYERGGDAMNALLMTETALVYSSSDKDLLQRKDKYYFSVTPERLTAVREKVLRFFDVEYCAAKAKSVLDQPNADTESLDWALHLVQLAGIVKPDNISVRVLSARGLLRQGQRDAALQVLEDVRELKPSGSVEQDAWYQATKLLGDLYLDELNRPDLAVNCFQDYRNFTKSGADTLFNLGRAYEAKGDIPNAIKFFDAVTAYDEHPKYWAAKDAVTRLKGA